MPGKITFILGGVRSGKSIYALTLAKKYKNVCFIATCLPLDGEMKKRIGLHKKSRPPQWQTFEEPKDIASLLNDIGGKFDLIIIDCLTLYISNMIMEKHGEDYIKNKIDDMLNNLKKIKARSIIVSNEVGLGIVPGNKMARNFRDIAGKMNQITAQKSNSVYFMVSGIPMKIK